MLAGTLETPFLISERLIEIKAPTSAFEEGQSDAARGLHYTANPYAEGTADSMSGMKGGWPGAIEILRV